MKSFFGTWHPGVAPGNVCLQYGTEHQKLHLPTQQPAHLQTGPTALLLSPLLIGIIVTPHHPPVE